MKNLLFTSLVLLSAISCQPPQQQTPQEPVTVAPAESPILSGKFVHMVFFWLKPETDVDAFVKGTEDFLKDVKAVKQYHIGKPAMTPRDVVDNTYTVCLIVTFDTKEDHEIYQKDPVHDTYRDAIKESIAKLQIYDSWNGE